MTIALWVYAAVLLGLGIAWTRDALSIPSLPAGDPELPRPRVSVIVAARDEALRIENSVTRLLAQTGIDLELLVVDDRSTDETPAILARLAERDERLQVLRVEELPDGWLGKPHACHLAASRATGEWLLFTDADAWMEPDLVRRAVDAARAGGADHLCLAPREAHTTFAARAALLNFSMAMVWMGAGVNHDRPFAFIGIGAFNLFGAEAFRAVGGYASMRMEVIDDAGLGRRVRRNGGRSRFFGAHEDLEVHWAPDVPGILRALEKNYFALFGYRFLPGVAALLVMTAAHLFPLLGLYHGGPAGWAAFVAPFSLIPAAAVVALRYGWGWPAALAAPLFGPVMTATLANSMLTAFRRGGVVWRDTFYSLERLRRR